MDDEEEDVFQPDPYSWRTTFQEIKCEDRGTQTPGPTLARYSGMLPFGVAEEPRPVFYGEACFIFTTTWGTTGPCVMTRLVKVKRETVPESPLTNW